MDWFFFSYREWSMGKSDIGFETFKGMTSFGLYTSPPPNFSFYYLAICTTIVSLPLLSIFLSFLRARTNDRSRPARGLWSHWCLWSASGMSCTEAKEIPISSYRNHELFSSSLQVYNMFLKMSKLSMYFILVLMLASLVIDYRVLPVKKYHFYLV